MYINLDIPSHLDPAVNKNLLPADQVDEENLYGDTNIEKAYNFLITKEGCRIISSGSSRGYRKFL